jgi:RNA polymerase primary sigma factor
MNKNFTSTSGDETISNYFKEVRKSVLITPEEEIRLAIKIQQGDKKAKDKLVKANLKFVISIAKEYQGQGLSLSDLISEGNLGLVRAATRYDHTRGFRFISYAVWWIKEAILKSLNDNSRIIRLPSNVIKKVSDLRKEINKFETENERLPIHGDLVDEYGETIETPKTPSCTSLNDVINEDGDELYCLIEDKNSTTEKEIFSQDDKIKEEIKNILSKLEPREKEVLESYFGLNKDYDGMTLEAIGEKYNLTKERIRQIKEKAIRRIRFNANGLFDILNG